MCRALGVSRSGFHAWQQRKPSAREQADVRLAMVIQATHMEHRQVYGTRRLWRVLSVVARYAAGIVSRDCAVDMAW